LILMLRRGELEGRGLPTTERIAPVDGHRSPVWG
jgi:hypothetical protein